CVSAAEVGAPHLRKRWFLLGFNSDRIDESALVRIPKRETSQPSGNGRDVSDTERFQLRDQQRGRSGESREGPAFPRNDGPQESLADAPGAGSRPSFQSRAAWEVFSEYGCAGAFAGIQRLPQPTICRDDDGFANRVDRIRAGGNGVVPEQVK